MLSSGDGMGQKRGLSEQVFLVNGVLTVFKSWIWHGLSFQKNAKFSKMKMTKSLQILLPFLSNRSRAKPDTPQTLGNLGTRCLAASTPGGGKHHH